MRKQFLIGLAFAAIAAYSFTCDFGAANVISIGNAAALDYAPQVSDERQVKVTATLKKIPKDAKTWDFEVSLETHTHALSDGMENSSVLVVEGKEYAPLGWEGSPPGGHHRKGILRFNAITPKPSTVELRVRLIGDPTPRSFKWQLE